MLKIICILFIVSFNSAYSHDLDLEYSEFQNKISYKLMASNHKKNKKDREKKKSSLIIKLMKEN